MIVEGVTPEFRAWWSASWPSRRPLASNDLRFSKMTSRGTAKMCRYVEPCPKEWRDRIVIDIDHPDAFDMCMWGSEGMTPNYIVETPSNGHAHATWLLAEPVPVTPDARWAPMMLLKAVTEGLRRHVRGDHAFAQRLTKNPLHPDWNLYQVHRDRYGLRTLADALAKCGCLPSPLEVMEADGGADGRNCTLFMLARKWAYREVRRHGDFGSFLGACEAHVTGLNMRLDSPLPTSEVRSIFRSVARWTWRSPLRRAPQEQWDATFSLMQSRRAAKSAKKRATARERFLASLPEDDGVKVVTGTVAQLAGRVGRSVRTVRRWLADVPHVFRMPAPAPTPTFGERERDREERQARALVEAAREAAAVPGTDEDGFDAWPEGDAPRALVSAPARRVLAYEGGPAVCPECGDPIWSGGACTCMQDAGQWAWLDEGEVEPPKTGRATIRRLSEALRRY